MEESNVEAEDRARWGQTHIVLLSFVLDSHHSIQRPVQSKGPNEQTNLGNMQFDVRARYNTYTRHKSLFISVPQ